MKTQTKQPKTIKLSPLELAKKNAEPRFNFSNNIPFNSSESDMLSLLQRVFRNHVTVTLNHTPKEISLLMFLFNMQINKDNIRSYINCHSKDIYQGLINDNLISIRQEHE